MEVVITVQTVHCEAEMLSQKVDASSMREIAGMFNTSAIDCVCVAFCTCARL